MSLLELFGAVDDFCHAFAPRWEQALIGDGVRERRRETPLSLSERMTIIIHFHQSGYRTFKVSDVFDRLLNRIHVVDRWEGAYRGAGGTARMVEKCITGFKKRDQEPGGRLPAWTLPAIRPQMVLNSACPCQSRSRA